MIVHELHKLHQEEGVDLAGSSDSSIDAYWANFAPSKISASPAQALAGRFRGPHSRDLAKKISGEKDDK